MKVGRGPVVGAIGYPPDLHEGYAAEGARPGAARPLPGNGDRLYLATELLSPSRLDDIFIATGDDAEVHLERAVLAAQAPEGLNNVAGGVEPRQRSVVEPVAVVVLDG